MKSLALAVLLAFGGGNGLVVLAADPPKVEQKKQDTKKKAPAKKDKAKSDTKKPGAKAAPTTDSKAKQ